jgi:hypothetical protein
MMGEGMTYNKAYMYIEEYREAMKYFNCDEWFLVEIWTKYLLNVKWRIIYSDMSAIWLVLTKVLIFQNLNIYEVKGMVDDLHIRELRNWKGAKI